MHIRKLTVGRRLPALPDGAVHRSSGTDLSLFWCLKLGPYINLYSYFTDCMSPTPTQVGPHAVNLAGGQAASMRIAKDVMHRQQQDNVEKSEQRGEKSKTEEYVQQMQGLLWL